MQDPERESELGALLGQAEVVEVYPMLVSYGKLITDYSTDAAVEPEDGDALDDEHGVAVEFEGDEEDEDSEGDEVMVPPPSLPHPPLSTLLACWLFPI